MFCKINKKVNISLSFPLFYDFCCWRYFCFLVVLAMFAPFLFSSSLLPLFVVLVSVVVV